VKDALELSCHVCDGRIPKEISDAVRDALRRLNGQRVIISVRKHVKRRSDRQNAYMWGVVIPYIHRMFVEAGNDATPEDVHDFLKQYVGGNIFVRILIEPGGGRRAVVRSSTTLTTEEWESYMEAIRAWAAERGCQIPLPNENLIHQGE
jgi:Arc/MetJ-type ribon-helix-helix transcriptional regulator